MTQFNDTELTAAVIRSFDETPDPRVKFLMEELVKSLHDFVRKTDLTFDEWIGGQDQARVRHRRDHAVGQDAIGIVGKRKRHCHVLAIASRTLKIRAFTGYPKAGLTERARWINSTTYPVVI